MRKCLRCNVKMIENLAVEAEGGAYGLNVTLPGIFRKNLGWVRGAVCPACGCLETYIEDVQKLVRAAKK